MDTWVPFAIVVVIVLAGFAVLAMRIARNRGAPQDPEDDAMRRESTEAYYRSQRDQTDSPPGTRPPGGGTGKAP